MPVQGKEKEDRPTANKPEEKEMVRKPKRSTALPMKREVKIKIRKTIMKRTTHSIRYENDLSMII